MRIRALLLIGFQLILWAIAWFTRLRLGGNFLDLPASLAGLVTPVLALRLFHRECRAEDCDRAGLAGASMRAIVLQSCASSLCLLAYFMSGNPLTFIGPLMLLVTAGAVWPTARRINALLDR